MAGRIPQEFINDLLDRVDVSEVIGARLELKRAGKEFKGLCPFHGEKTPSFHVVPEKGFYHCFGCGVHGTALTFLLEHDRLEFVQAVETLAAMAG
ncbi:MAG: CHC2 zinc finger domain-containing protein, partial [Pseudomonadales bacterium]